MYHQKVNYQLAENVARSLRGPNNTHFLSQVLNQMRET